MLNKHFLASAVALSVLAGCGSTPPVNQEVSAEIQANINAISLNGTLIKQQDSFVLAPTLSVDNADSNNMLDAASWQFNGKTLFPAFKTERFECSIKKQECTQYEDTTSPFVKVNGTQSDYGDTYDKRVADGKKPGISAADVAFYGAASVILAPSAVLVGAPLALINSTANLISHGSVWQNKWVEFDHDSFYEQTAAAIQAKHGSLENYVSYMASASVAYNELTQYNDSLYADLNSLRADNTAALSQYQPMKLAGIDAYRFDFPAYGDIFASRADIESQINGYYAAATTTLLTDFNEKLAQAKMLYVEQQQREYAAAKTVQATSGFIRKYKSLDEGQLIGKAKAKLKALYVEQQQREYAGAKTARAMMDFIKKYQSLDHAQLIGKAQSNWKTLVKAEQQTAFDKIKTIGDANRFISTYQHIDEANLVSQARDLVAKAERRIANEKLEKRNAVLARLDSWRKSLSVGDMTFCGRVIEARYPMFNIALSHPLQGFSDTIWLEKDNVFELQSGCNNRNNQLTPLTDPFA